MANDKDPVFCAADIIKRAKLAKEFKTDSELAAFLGISRSTLSNWNARNSIDFPLLLGSLDDVDYNWLLTGKGNMLNTDAREASFSEQSHGVPFYDVDFCGGFDMMVNDQSAVPTGYIDFPQYNRADSWARITGHSMEPLISNGDIIALRKVEDWQSYLLYGEIYGIMTNEYRTVKRIRKAQDPAKVLLEPINKDFDTIELDKRLIMGVWAVLGCAKKFF